MNSWLDPQWHKVRLKVSKTDPFRQRGGCVCGQSDRSSVSCGSGTGLPGKEGTATKASVSPRRWQGTHQGKVCQGGDRSL